MLTTTHQFDAYCDSLTDAEDFALSSTYEVFCTQQMQHEIEMDNARENDLKREGACEVLKMLRKKLTEVCPVYGVYKETNGKDTVGYAAAGLAVAVKEVDALLKQNGGAA